ncbi:MAG TPA: tail fiber domain-containing protein, partial [bacterium]|nr:tail fiber domain-containing protein [bacterium]
SRRWKMNINTLSHAVDKVCRLRGVEYDNAADGGHAIGLIAEEVGAVIPEVVQYETNGVDAAALDYGRLVAVLIEAIKEQQRQIDLLNRKLERITP